MSKELGFRVVEERGRHLTRTYATEEARATSRRATEEEVLLWAKVRELQRRVSVLEPEAEPAPEDSARMMAESSAEARRQCYELLRQQARLVKTAERAADQLRLLARSAPSPRSAERGSDLRKELQTLVARMAVARDVAAESTSVLRDFSAAVEEAREALGVSLSGRAAEEPTKPR